MFAQRVGALYIALAVSASARSAPGGRDLMLAPVQDGFMPSQEAVPGLTLSK